MNRNITYVRQKGTLSAMLHTKRNEQMSSLRRNGTRVTGQTKRRELGHRSDEMGYGNIRNMERNKSIGPSVRRTATHVIDQTKRNTPTQYSRPYKALHAV